MHYEIIIKSSPYKYCLLFAFSATSFGGRTGSAFGGFHFYNGLILYIEHVHINHAPHLLKIKFCLIPNLPQLDSIIHRLYRLLLLRGQFPKIFTVVDLRKSLSLIDDLVEEPRTSSLGTPNAGHYVYWSRL